MLRRAQNLFQGTQLSPSGSLLNTVNYVDSVELHEISRSHLNRRPASLESESSLVRVFLTRVQTRARIIL